jgi:hypothetical protein
MAEAQVGARQPFAFGKVTFGVEVLSLLWHRRFRE